MNILTDAEAEAPTLWPPDAKSRLIGEGVERRESSCTVGGNVNRYSRYESSMGVP